MTACVFVGLVVFIAADSPCAVLFLHTADGLPRRRKVSGNASKSLVSSVSPSVGVASGAASAWMRLSSVAAPTELEGSMVSLASTNEEPSDTDEQEASSAVVAWSSSHLSDDDSDEEEASASSRSPSHSVEEEEEDKEREESSGGQEEDEVADDDNWMLDLDLPDGSAGDDQLAPSPPLTNEKPEPMSPSDLDSPGSEARVSPAYRFGPPESVETSSTSMTSQGDEGSPIKRASLIPRLMPPLTRQMSGPVGMSPPKGSTSPLRLQRSASKTSSLVEGISSGVPEPQLSPTSLQRKRGQSVYITTGSVASRTLKHADSAQATQQRGIVTSSSQFWASEQNKRSSRLLDEWKRKEIWHDFKKAEETVLTGTGSGASTESSSTVAARPSLDTKPVSPGSLDDVLEGIRSDILGKQSELHRQMPTMRRATSFATKTSTSPGKSAISIPATVEWASSEALHVNSAYVSSSGLSKMLPATTESVSKADYDRLVEEKRRLAEEAESRQRALVAEQEAMRAVNERLMNLENLDRENRFLKEEIQKHLMHELSSKELVKTLEDQLGLTARSEDQLKLQTRQLMQQNQALQSDLLEKIAAETSKIQKMAHLSAEKQKLQEDLQRNETQSAHQVAQQKTQVRTTLLRHLVKTRRLTELRIAFSMWQIQSRQQSAANLKAANIIVAVSERMQMKAKARAFRQLQSHALVAAYEERALQVQTDHAAIQSCLREACRRAGAGAAALVWRRRVRAQAFAAFKVWQDHTRAGAEAERRLTTASAMLKSILQSHSRASTLRAFGLWKLQVHFDSHRQDSERAKVTEAELVEAKDCVFALSRAKTRLEEKLQSSRQDVQRAGDQLREHRSELQLVKHGFVTTVVRETERAWLRSIFTEWRLQAQVEACAKEYRLQLEMAELKVEERDKYARSLDDYNKVLRNDLERFQFFSQDKRIAVDVLAKKLLREEDKLRHMEEQHVVLEEKMLSYKAQLASILDWQGGVSMPIALVHLCRDASAGNLRELFVRSASSSHRGPDKMETPTCEADEAALSVRLAVNDLVQLVRDSNAIAEASAIDVNSLVRRNVPEYATTQGLLFADFVTSLSAIAKDAFGAADKPNELTKVFWSYLLSRLGVLPRGAVAVAAQRDVNDPPLHVGRSPWAGQLSEDILQNQEKLLAVLEHETAVVERAVMEKSSLKHTYAASEHSVASTVKEFQEYQCDPMMPPESQTTDSASAAFASADSQFVGNGLDQFANWSQSGQVQDLFLAFRNPLQRIVTKYSNEKRVAAHGNQICLVLSGVSRMLEDMRLYPAYLSRELVHHHFGRLSDRDGLLTPQALAMFLGCCALELFAKSLPNDASAFRLSAREIVLSFFCDLGFLTDSEIPAPPRICLVGTEVESVLWPLFEYYAISDDDVRSAHQDPRVGMTIEKFLRFAADIINLAPHAAERLFQRVINETRRPMLSSSAFPDVGIHSTAVKMHLDDFYVAIAFVQEERCPGVQYANLGEAVRHWMQQTQ